jgi:tRNA-modifying protein YgfZ
MRNQYRIIETQAGHLDQRARGRLRLTGADAVSFLQALVSNDVAALQPGTGCYATYLTPQGRMLADFDVLRRPDGLFCSLAPGQLPALAQRLDQLLFSEDVTIADLSTDWGELAVLGTGAPGIVAAAFDLPAAALEALPDLAQLDLPDGFVARSTDVALPMFRVFTSAAGQALAVARLEAAGAQAVDDEVLETLRIEHGRPRWGADLGDDVIPLEAGLLERGISTSKGCYVGQEIVIRILHRGGGRVAKRLVRLHVPDDLATPPEPGSPFEEPDGTVVGRLTSVSPAARGPGFVALGYVSRDHAEVGRVVRLARANLAATVVGLAG